LKLDVSVFIKQQGFVVVFVSPARFAEFGNNTAHIPTSKMRQRLSVTGDDTREMFQVNKHIIEASVLCADFKALLLILYLRCAGNIGEECVA